MTEKKMLTLDSSFHSSYYTLLLHVILGTNSDEDSGIRFWTSQNDDERMIVWRRRR
ncbi:hypothetical protein KJ953_01685 [Patescibacteria group bacterium]|nr:hypothetical protein [Patescibacteria group bacterium]MBU1457909.1 hypothetical protein [Patescibacteria group bacterium]